MSRLPRTKKIQNITITWLFFGLSIVGLWACSSSQHSAKHDIESPRIVSLVPALSATLKKLDATSRLIGVTPYCPVSNVPVVTGATIQPERILALKPNLVLGLKSQSQFEDVSNLRVLGLNVEEFPLLTLSDMEQSAQRLATLTRTDAKPVLDAWNQGLSPIAFKSKAPRVLLVYSVEGNYLYTTGGGDYLSELITQLGAQLALKGQPTMRIGVERALAAAPDVILHVAPTSEYPSHESARQFWSQFPHIPAVRQGTIYVHPNSNLGLNALTLLDELPLLRQWLGEQTP